MEAPSTIARRLKDSDASHLCQCGPTEGAPNRLPGFPVMLAEAMPDVAADAMAIAFGDFQQGYAVVEHTGIRRLTDPYTARPNLLLHACRRIGGGTGAFDAIKRLKFGTAYRD